ncbi:WD repeat-containing protein 25 [Glycine soja]
MVGAFSQNIVTLTGLPMILLSESDLTNPLCGSILDADIHHNILSLLKSIAKGHQSPTLISEKLCDSIWAYKSCQCYALVINSFSPPCICWDGSCGLHMECMEQKSEESMPAKLPVFHNAAVKDVKWSQQGHFLLSCGYDCTSRLIDVEKGLETQVFRQDQIVGVIKLHPDDSNLFLSEGSKGQIKLCDARTGKVVHDYNQNLGLILDVEFTMNGKQFISSSDVSQSNASENAIIVWDVSREVPLSNQSCVILLRHKFRNSICTSTTVKAAYNDPPQYLCIVRSLRALGPILQLLKHPHMIQGPPLE